VTLRAVVSLWLVIGVCKPCWAADSRDLDLAAMDGMVPTIQKLIGKGKCGIGVKFLESGETWFYQKEAHFPMQSVCKFPLAVAILIEVDAKHLSLIDRVSISRSDLSVEWSPISQNFKGSEESFSIGDLLKRAVGESDNTAFDVLLARIGGARTIDAALRAKGIDGIRVDRSERQLQSDYFGLGPWDPRWVDPNAFEAAQAALGPVRQRKALLDYLDDPRDTATPAGMVLLLERFYQGQLLSESSTRYLLKVMKETTTGPNRLKAGLPSGTLLAHKTGTAGDSVAINGATNDVGVAKLPDGAEVIIAVFIKGSDASSKNREAAIAEVARNVVKTRYRPLKAAGFRITLFEGTAATGSGECLGRKGCTVS
jgi:beta-lactamase class A